MRRTGHGWRSIAWDVHDVFGSSVVLDGETKIHGFKKETSNKNNFTGGNLNLPLRYRLYKARHLWLEQKNLTHCWTFWNCFWRNRPLTASTLTILADVGYILTARVPKELKQKVKLAKNEIPDPSSCGPGLGYTLGGVPCPSVFNTASNKTFRVISLRGLVVLYIN